MRLATIAAALTSLLLLSGAPADATPVDHARLVSTATGGKWGLTFNAATYLATSGSNRYIVYGVGADAYDTSVDAWYLRDLRTGDTKRLPKFGQTWGISNDGATILYTPRGSPGELRLYDVPTGTAEPVPTSALGAGEQVDEVFARFSADGRSVLRQELIWDGTTSRQRIVYWDQDTGHLSEGPVQEDGGINWGGRTNAPLSISADGSTVAYATRCPGSPDSPTAYELGCLLVWQPITGRSNIFPLPQDAHQSRIYEVAISANGEYCAWMVLTDVTGQRSRPTLYLARTDGTGLQTADASGERYGILHSVEVSDNGSVAYVKFSRARATTVLFLKELGEKPTAALLDAEPAVFLSAQARNVVVSNLRSLAPGDKDEAVDAYRLSLRSVTR